MHFAYSYAFSIAFSQPASWHSYLLRCLPREEGFQRVLSSTLLVQGLPASARPDGLGNPTTVGIDTSVHDAFEVRGSGIVDQRAYRICASEESRWLHPTPLTSPVPGMRDLVRDSLGQGSEDELDRVHLVCSAVHAHLTYEKGVTDALTTSADAFRKRRGVCQDYAHLAATCLRLAGIPARYVCGFVPGEGESHAWVEAFASGVWHGIDPTRQELASPGHIKVAHGRDSADCPMNRGCMRGGGVQTTTISITVHPL